jgi:hypothetical protein
MQLGACLDPRALLRGPPSPGLAALAQPVEHIIRNDGVRCSSHLSGTTLFNDLAKFSSHAPLAGGVQVITGYAPDRFHYAVPINDLPNILVCTGPKPEPPQRPISRTLRLLKIQGAPLYYAGVLGVRKPGRYLTRALRGNVRGLQASMPLSANDIDTARM